MNKWLTILILVSVAIVLGIALLMINMPVVRENVAQNVSQSVGLGTLITVGVTHASAGQ